MYRIDPTHTHFHDDTVNLRKLVYMTGILTAYRSV